MRYFLPLITAALLPIAGFAQSLSPQVLSPAGTVQQAGGATLSWTLGQTAVATQQGAGLMLTQGFQQPFSLVVSGPENLGSVVAQGTLALFPNPAANSVNLRAQFPARGELRLSVTDLHGRRIHEYPAVQTADGFVLQRLNLSHLPAAMYTLRVDFTPAQGPPHPPQFLKFNLVQ